MSRTFIEAAIKIYNIRSQSKLLSSQQRERDWLRRESHGLKQCLICIRLQAKSTTTGIRTFVYFRMFLRFALRSPFLGRTTDNMRNLILCHRAFKLRMQDRDSFDESSGPCLKLLQHEDASPHRSKRQRLELLDQNCSPTSAQQVLLSDSECDDAEAQQSEDSCSSVFRESAASDSDVEMISCTAAPCAADTLREPPGRSEADQPEHAATPQKVVKRYLSGPWEFMFGFMRVVLFLRQKSL